MQLMHLEDITFANSVLIQCSISFDSLMILVAMGEFMNNHQFQQFSHTNIFHYINLNNYINKCLEHVISSKSSLTYTTMLYVIYTIQLVHLSIVEYYSHISSSHIYYDHIIMSFIITYIIYIHLQTMNDVRNKTQLLWFLTTAGSQHSDDCHRNLVQFT